MQTKGTLLNITIPQNFCVHSLRFEAEPPEFHFIHHAVFQGNILSVGDQSVLDIWKFNSSAPCLLFYKF